MEGPLRAENHVNPTLSSTRCLSLSLSFLPLSLFFSLPLPISHTLTHTHLLSFFHQIPHYFVDATVTQSMFAARCSIVRLEAELMELKAAVAPTTATAAVAVAVIGGKLVEALFENEERRINPSEP